MTVPPLNPTAQRRRFVNDVAQARCAWLIACDLAARATGADVRVVMQTRGTSGRGGDEKTSTARKIACYLAQVVANASSARLSEASGLDRSTIYVHSSWVTDKRDDDPKIDRMVGELEDQLLAMATSVVMAHLTARGEVFQLPPPLLEAVS